MSPEHNVIFIHGLGDRQDPLKWAVRGWQKHNLEPIMHSVGWRDKELSFEPKLNRLVEMIDEISEKGDLVSLVGTSAGGSAALNAFVERKEVVHKVINVCGRLRTGPTSGFRSFEAKSKSSPSFAESVKLFESREESLSDADKQKIMTVRAMFGDELVPPETTILQGAYNTTVPTIEHVLSITAALTIFSQPLITFLKSEAHI